METVIVEGKGYLIDRSALHIKVFDMFHYVLIALFALLWPE